MESEEGVSDTPLLDEWRAELGDETIGAVVEVARGKIAEGSVPGFSDKHYFLEHLREPHPRSA